MTPNAIHSRRGARGTRRLRAQRAMVSAPAEGRVGRGLDPRIMRGDIVGSCSDGPRSERLRSYWFVRRGRQARVCSSWYSRRMHAVHRRSQRNVKAFPTTAREHPARFSIGVRSFRLTTFTTEHERLPCSRLQVSASRWKLPVYPAQPLSIGKVCPSLPELASTADSP